MHGPAQGTIIDRHAEDPTQPQGLEEQMLRQSLSLILFTEEEFPKSMFDEDTCQFNAERGSAFRTTIKYDRLNRWEEPLSFYRTPR